MELHMEKLRTVRKLRKLTAEEVAKKLGISRVTLGAWENAKRTPSEAKIRMLAKALDVSVDEISDLAPDKAISEIHLAPLSASIRSALGGGNEMNLGRQADLVSGIVGMIKELSDAKLIIKAMVSSLPLIFYVKGADLKYLAVSEGFLRNLSLSPDYDVAGKTDFDLFPQNEAKANYELDKEVLASGKGVLDREGHVPGNRKTRWGIMSKTPILDAKGKVEGVVGYFIDITDRKRAEEKYDRIVNMSPNLICVAGMDGYFKFVNPTWERTLGYTAAELLAKPFLSFIRPEDQARSAAELESLALGKPSLDFENHFVHKDGSSRHLLWTSAPMVEERLVYCIGRDITESRKVEEQLRVHQVELETQNEELRRTHLELEAARTRYFDLYNLAPVGFCTLSDKGLILEANATTATLLGVGRGVLAKQPLTCYVLPDDQDSYYLKRKALLATGEQQSWDMRMRRADGQFFRAFLQAAPTPGGECMVTITDLTGRKRLEP